MSEPESTPTLTPTPSPAIPVAPVTPVASASPPPDLTDFSDANLEFIAKWAETEQGRAYFAEWNLQLMAARKGAEPGKEVGMVGVVPKAVVSPQ